jgi:hypothetical protein
VPKIVWIVHQCRQVGGEVQQLPAQGRTHGMGYGGSISTDACPG